MTINRTTLLDLPLPVTGTESGFWGDITNNGLTEYLDIAIAGSLSLSSDADVDLATTEGNASGTNVTSTTAQYMILNCSGSRSAIRNINAPKQSKLYVVVNGTTGGYGVVLRGGPTTPTTGVTIANGSTTLCAWNGSDFVAVSVTSFATPLTVVGNATAGSEIRLPEDTDNGSNYAAVKAPDSLASNVTLTLPSQTATLGYINIPQSGSAKTTAYTLATSDVGEFIEVGSGGSIEIPNSTFSAGDAILVFNNTSGGITITCTITTAYIAGTDSDKATVTLATRGVASILFVSGTVCVISGNVS